MADRSQEEMRRLMQRGGFFRKLHVAYELLFCLALTANVAIAVFDFTYLENIPYTPTTMRDVYLELSRRPEFSFLKHKDPKIDLFYDPIKGIERHRATDSYVEDFRNLRTRLGSEREFSAENRALMQSLVDRAGDMINKRPPLTDFSLAEKDGALEHLKDKMRLHFMQPGEKLRDLSAKKAFERFFSPENLTVERRAAEFRWFEEEIVPILAANYFRWIDDDGRPKNYFSRRIDFWFVLLLFWPDFLIRWAAAIFTRRYRRWYLFPVRNWVSVFLLISPHHAAWVRLLRVLPLYSRLNANGWIPGGGIMPGILHDNAAVIAEEISGMVLVNIIAQVQAMLEKRAVNVEAITSSDALQQIQRLTDQQAGILASKMVPQIQPDIADLVEYSINHAMGPFINTPLGGPFRLALSPVHDRVREGLRAALASPEGSEQMRAILQKSTRIVLEQLTAQENLGVLQEQIARVLEEVKQEIAAAIED